MKHWSPWFIMETSAQIKLTGEDGKIGTIHAWNGDIIGAGEMEITAKTENKSIDYDLRVFKPWKSTAKTSFRLAEDGNKTTVTWTMEGQLPMLLGGMKSMMEAWIGMDYERGLRMLKEYAETGAVISEVNILPNQKTEAFQYVGIRNTCAIDDVGPAMERDFETLEKKSPNLSTTGLAFSIYHHYDLKRRGCSYTSGLGVANFPSELEVPFNTGQVASTQALVVEHNGPYENLGNAWSAGYSYLRAHKLKQNRTQHPYEIYLNNPKKTYPKDLKTVLYFPLR